MRTRCPACSTAFRVTPEQLRLRAGKVRCGHCQAVFNAFDELSGEATEPVIEAPVMVDEAGSPVCDGPFDPPATSEPEFVEPGIEVDVEAPERLDEQAEGVPEEPFTAPPVIDEFEPAEGQFEIEAEFDAQPEAEQDTPPEAPSVPEDVPPGDPVVEAVELIQAPLDQPLVESPEQSTEAARQAGLVAARELTESASFNRWSAGTLAGDGLGGFESDANRRAVWPFWLAAIVLLVGLLGQLLHYFRTDIVLRFPGMGEVYELAGADIPLPRNAALVSIETSDLQADNARGLFVLQATLKNRAGYAQAWPALELSLTDTNDAVVSRRVMFAADYLPPGTVSDAFPANGDMPVKLWIEARESGASGYRLYIFYP